MQVDQTPEIDQNSERASDNNQEEEVKQAEAYDPEADSWERYEDPNQLSPEGADQLA